MTLRQPSDSKTDRILEREIEALLKVDAPADFLPRLAVQRGSSKYIAGRYCHINAHYVNLQAALGRADGPSRR
jgi:hypothetical protein